MPYLIKFHDTVQDLFGISNAKDEETAIKNLFNTLIDEFGDVEKADEDLAKIRSMNNLSEIKKFSFHVGSRKQNHQVSFLKIEEIPMEDYAVFTKYGLKVNFYE